MASDDTTMRALWLEGGRAWIRDDLALPRPRPHEARIRVDCAGICGTDAQLLSGYADFAGVPGHELVGTVEEGPRAWIGRRVVVDINFGCGDCDTCRREGPHHCGRRRVLGIRGASGALAEWTLAPVSNLVEVPAAMTDETAVFAEPVAAAIRAAEQLEREGSIPGPPVAVLGAGRLGQLVGRVLRLRGVQAVLWGRSGDSLARAANAGLETRPAAELPADGIDALVDCTGTPEGLAAALAALRPRGTLVLKSTYRARTAVDLAPIVVKELRVLGSRCGDLAAALVLLAADLDPRDLIDARYPLQRAATALHEASAPGKQKILVLPHS